MAITLAIDIGGTKIAWGLIDDNSPQAVLTHGRVPSQPPGATTADQVENAVKNALTAASKTGLSIDRIGVASAGVIDTDTSTVSRAGLTMPGWEGTNIAALINHHTDAPVFAHNDVRVWACGEHALYWHDKYPQARLLYTTLGTGVGGAFVVDNDLVGGHRHTAGEISELFCPRYGGTAARCEDVASGPGLVATYRAAVASDDPSATTPTASHPSTVTDLLQLEQHGDPLAAEVLDHNLRGFGQMLGSLAMALDLDAIILGGGVISLGEGITQRITNGVRTHLPYRIRPCALHTGALHEGPLVAAAMYARMQHAQS
ncbi:ROK family protein [Corynebacterium kroppenstedtii]|uniref:ROK family protein n=1 Tax=Corynebacterium sp. PCR 32 TaxID=3351342 RepID=UPI0030A207B6